MSAAELAYSRSDDAANGDCNCNYNRDYNYNCFGKRIDADETKWNGSFLALSNRPRHHEPGRCLLGTAARVGHWWRRERQCQSQSLRGSLRSGRLSPPGSIRFIRVDPCPPCSNSNGSAQPFRTGTPAHTRLLSRP